MTTTTTKPPTVASLAAIEECCDEKFGPWTIDRYNDRFSAYAELDGVEITLADPRTGIGVSAEHLVAAITKLHGAVAR